MASKSAKSTLGRVDPNLKAAIRMANGDVATALAVDDAAMEAGALPTDGTQQLLVSQLMIGQTYWIETPIWCYVGTILEKGLDYIKLGKAVRIHSDGHHSVMMQTGTAPHVEMAPTGGPSRVIFMPVDWIGPCCHFPFPLTDEDVPSADRR